MWTYLSWKSPEVTTHLFSNFHLVPAGQDLEVGFERALIEDALVLGGVERLPEQDVVLERRVLDPRLLRHVRQLALEKVE